MHRPSYIVIVLALCALLPQAIAESLYLEAVWTTIPKDSLATAPEAGMSLKQTNVIWIKTSEKNGELFEMTDAAFNLQHPAFTDPSFWHVTATKGGKPQVVEHRVVPIRGRESGFTRLYLVPVKKPSEGPEYKVVPAGTNSLAGFVKPPHRIVNEAAFRDTAIDSKFLKDNIAHVDANEGVKTNVSLKTGDKNTAKLELFWGYEERNEKSDWKWQFHALAEGSYRPKESEKALSNILGEVEYLYTTDLGFAEDPVLAAVWQIGGVARIQSDQDFENVEGSIGASTWFALNGSAIKGAADALCLNGDAEPFAAPLLLNLSYTYVQKMENNTPGEREGFYDETHRLSGKIYWSFALLRDLHLERISSKLDTYNLNVVINSGFAYDFRASEFFPDIEASLELTPQSDDGKPSFVLTYKNGKSTTRFENYDALLAGIKIPF